MNLALKVRILASGKSQISLAREIGISEPQFSKIVMGWIDPGKDLKRKIAQALNVPESDIFPPSRETHNGQIDGSQRVEVGG